MDIYGLKCPCCGAPLDDVDDGRINFFCSYCGSALCVVYKDGEADNIIKIKAVETGLNNSRADLARESVKLAKESARVIEAETEQMRLENRIKASKHSKAAGVSMIVMGALVLMAELFSVMWVLSRYSFSVSGILTAVGKPMMIAVLCLIFAGIMISVALIILGVRKIDELTEAEKDIIEEKIERLKDNFDVLQKLFDEQKAVERSLRFSLLGKKARIKKAAKKRAREIKDEMSYVESQIREYENAL
ncbi:MAG: zinc ribbon domain-containing protein [Lachnospiraceae bacterium]|nr:zinc ribbon domain-containing protein [Lachnospiraceae bacterium]